MTAKLLEVLLDKERNVISQFCLHPPEHYERLMVENQ